MSIPNPLHDLFFWLAIGGWVMSGIVYALPDPTKESSSVYVFVFRLLHFLANNVDKLKLPLK
jgi:hypothetical protein